MKHHLKFKVLTKLSALGIITISALAATNAYSFDIGPKISTLGFGIEAQLYDFGPVALRANANILTYSRGINSGSLNYNSKLELKNAGLYADLYPFAGGLKLIGGIVYNKNKFALSATPANNVTLFGNTYTPAQIGTATGTITFNKFSPYLGIGYDIKAFKAATLSLELGVLFQGSPNVNMTATGSFANNPQLISNLTQDVQNRTNKAYIKYYPVVGIALRF